MSRKILKGLLHTEKNADAYPENQVLQNSRVKFSFLFLLRR